MLHTNTCSYECIFLYQPKAPLNTVLSIYLIVLTLSTSPLSPPPTVLQCVYVSYCTDQRILNIYYLFNIHYLIFNIQN